MINRHQPPILSNHQGLLYDIKGGKKQWGVLVAVCRSWNIIVMLLVILLASSTQAQDISLVGDTYPSTVSVGSQGADVKLLQEYLAQLSIYSGSIDGIFGPVTQISVKHFQARVFLPITGIVDNITWRNLREALVRRPLIVGYYNSGGIYDSFPVLLEYGDVMTAIAPAWFWLENDGNINGNIDAMAILTARKKGVRVLGLISNLRYDTSTAKAQVQAVLQDETFARKVISNIIWLVDRFQLDGINLDFEYVRPQDKTAFTNFVRNLGAQLHARGRWFTISAPAKTADIDFANGFNGGFDYKALGQYADHLMLMAYDKHWAGGEPGPVAPFDWVSNVLAYARKTMHPSKVVLALNAYGYDWHSGSERARAITMRNVNDWALAKGVNINWDSNYLVPYAIYTDAQGKKRQAWLENGDSIAHKMELVSRYSIAGFAWWRMGYEDQSFWHALQNRWPYPTGWRS